MPTETELARIRALMQGPPTEDPMSGLPLDYESSSDYVDPAEQRLTLPRGISASAHRGGLQDVALSSRLSDLGRLQPDQGPPRGPGSEEAALRGLGTSPAAAGPSGGPGISPSFVTRDPAAFAKADQAQRQLGAERGLARLGGKLVGMVIGAAMAGGASGTSGAGGTEAGATSGAGFGANYWSGLKGGGGEGWGGFLGRLSSKAVSQQSGDRGQLSRLSGSGGGGSGGGGMGDVKHSLAQLPWFAALENDPIEGVGSALTGDARQRRLAALEAAGYGPYDSGMTSGPIWAGR